MTIRRFIVPLAAIAVVAVAAEAQAQGAFPAPLPGASAQSDASPFPPVNGAAAARPSPFPPVNQTSAPAQSPFPPVNSQAAAPAPSPFPPVGGASGGGAQAHGAAPLTGGFTPAPSPQQAGEACMKEFMPLRQETERRGERIKKASERKAPPSEACKLIGEYAQAEIRMMKFVESNAQRCGIPADVSGQMRSSHKNTLQLRSRVCAAAAQMQQQPRGPAAPSLSEALGAAVMPQANANRPTGGSTFDTLTGNVLQR